MENEKVTPPNKSDWFLRFIKGMFIGSGFILPGVSGGALAAVFGIYERIISFLAHISKNFKENVRFFIPVGLGGIAGVFVLCFVLGFWFLWQGSSLFGTVEQNFFTWMIAGALIGLGLIVPGLSPSNFLVYMGMYKAMADGFKTIDLSVIIPIGIGGLITVLSLSKVMDWVFNRFYAPMFHFILGIVFASTIMIIPTNYSGLGLLGFLGCAVLCILGAALGWWMSRLEERYVPES